MPKVIVLAVLGGAWTATGCQTARAFTAGDRAAIEEVLEAQRVAWNRGDLEGYMAGYERSPALVFTSGGTIRRGWEETLRRYRARYGEDSSSMGALRFEVLEVRALGADGAVVLGRWELRDTPQAGQGVFSVVFARTGDGWRVVHDHTSASPADVEDAKEDAKEDAREDAREDAKEDAKEDLSTPSDGG